MDSIIKTVISKATNSEGYITGIGKNGVQVSFTNGFGSILIPYEKYDDLLKADETVNSYVKEYRELSRKKEDK